MLLPLITLPGALLVTERSGATVHGSRYTKGKPFDEQTVAKLVTTTLMGGAGRGVPGGVPLGQAAAVAAPVGAMTVMEVPFELKAVGVAGTVPNRIWAMFAAVGRFVPLIVTVAPSAA